MSKRADGEGSVWQRQSTGRWIAEITPPGATRSITRTRKTQREAVAALNELKRQIEGGHNFQVERQTVAQYLEDWLATAETRLRPSTYQRHAEYVRLHTVPTLGRLQLTALTAQHLQRLYAGKLAAGLSPTTVRHLHAVLRAALGQAVRLGVLGANPAERATPPRAARLEMQTLTPEQARLFLAAATGDRLEALYVLALTTGMRRGELLGLRWTNVDLDGGSLRVVVTASQVGSQMIFGEPKTPRSRRRISLGESAVRALRAHRAQQAAERLKAGAQWVDSGLVFTDGRGGVLRPQNLARRSFAPLLERAGLPSIRFHDLRHTAATLLLGRGMHPKIVSEMLGHSNIAMTMDLYSHTTPTMHEAAARAMDDLLRGQT